MLIGNSIKYRDQTIKVVILLSATVDNDFTIVMVVCKKKTTLGQWAILGDFNKKSRFTQQGISEKK